MAVKRKFIEVYLPNINDSMSVLGDPEFLKNKTIKLDLSRKLKGRGVEAVFQILPMEEGLVGYPKKVSLMRNYIQRMMRKRISYVEDSFLSSCKDVQVTIKPFLITRKKVSKAVKNNLRKTAKEFILEYVKSKDYLELVEEILQGELQKEMYPKLKKVYPLSLCEIRVVETKEITKANLSAKRKSKKEIVKETEELSQIEEIEKELEKKKKEEVKEEIEKEEETKEKKPTSKKTKKKEE